MYLQYYLLVKNMDKIIAHRGIHNNKIKENTYLAIMNAFNNKNIVGVEFDIRLTKDNEIVVIHDDYINRTSNGIGKVEKMTLKELRKYNYGTKNFYQSIPLLNKILDINTDKLFLIEIKTDNNNENFANELIKVINKFKNKNMCYASFDKNILDLLRKKNKNISIGKICLNNRIKSYKYNFYLLFSKFINVKSIDNLLDKNKDVFIWTINNKKELNKIKNKLKNKKIFYIVDIK